MHQMHMHGTCTGLCAAPTQRHATPGVSARQLKTHACADGAEQGKGAKVSIQFDLDNKLINQTICT